MVRPQILVLSHFTHVEGKIAAWKELAARHDYDVIEAGPETKEEFLAVLNGPGANVHVIASTAYTGRKVGYTPELIAQIPDSVKAVVHQGAGYDVLGPIEHWKKKGITVTNTPGGVAVPTAEGAVFLLLAAIRGFQEASTNLREGKWRANLEPGLEPEDLVVGIVGLGSIGKLIRDRLIAFNFAKLQYYNRRRLPVDEEKGTHYVSHDELIKTSDVIVYAVPYSQDTHHLLDAEQLSKAKNGVVIVNIARGGVLDEQAVVDGLESGKIRAVGLDVFEREPEVHPGLLKHPRSFLLPHVAAFTTNTQARIQRDLRANVEAFITTGKLLTVVPELRE